MIEMKNKNKQNKCKKYDDTYMTSGIIIGYFFGAAIGQVIFDNMWIGAGFGMCLGLGSGAGIKKKSNW